MTTLPLRAPYQPTVWSHITHFASRVASIAVAVLETYSEAQRQSRELEKRYPFTYWT